MAGKGFRIADAYVAVTLDKSQLRDDLAKLPSDLGSDAERAGNDTGKRLGKGVSDGTDAKTVGKKVAQDLGDSASTEAEKQGQKTGDKMSQGMQKGLLTSNPLITAVIAGSLIAGAPVLAAAATTLFAGIALAAVHNNAEIKAAFADLKSTVSDTFSSAASVTVPMFVGAMDRIGQAVQALGPQFKTAFSALGPAISSLTTGVINLVQNAMPGLIAVVKASGPVFQGLASLLGSIGTGLSGLFQAIAEHGQAASTVFSSIGSILGSLLPLLGSLVGEGAQLASAVLPPLASILGVVAKVLGAIMPVLGPVALAFGGFKLASMAAGYLQTFSQQLGFAAFAMGEGKFAGALGAASTGVGKLAGALPALGAALAAGMMAYQAYTQQVNTWADALNKGGVASAQATAQMNDTVGYTDKYGGSLARVMDKLGMFVGVQQVANAASGDAKSKAKELTDAMSPLEQRQQAVTQASNELQKVLADPNHTAAQAASASQDLANKQGALTGFQQQLTSATQGAATAADKQKSALQGISDKASAANTQIMLLKGALDALTGTATTEAEAEIAVTQATVAATTATQGHTGALVDSSGALTTATDKGAAAQQALIQLSGASHQLIATMQQQGQSTDVVSAKSDQLRQQFINTATQMGYTAGQAQDLANKYYGIPGQITTTIIANDQASGVISRVQGLIAGLHNKDIFITTYSRVVSSGPAGLGGAMYPQALGGVVHAFAGGGFEPMQGGIAQIVPPKSLRVIGDRVTDDEAYIPINTSVRSSKILGETASRMGYALTPGPSVKSGGTATGTVAGGVVVQNLNVNIAGTMDLTDPSAARTVAVKIRDAMVRLEREQR